MRGVLVEVLWGNVMVLTVNHLAETGEEPFRLPGAGLAIGLHFAVVDARGAEMAVQGIPMRALVRVHGRAGRDVIDGMGNPGIFYPLSGLPQLREGR